MDMNALAKAFEKPIVSQQERIKNRMTLLLVVVSTIALFGSVMGIFTLRGLMTLPLLFTFGSLAALRLPHYDQGLLRVRNICVFLILGISAVLCLLSRIGLQEYSFHKDFKTRPLIVREAALLLSSEISYYRGIGPFMYLIEVNSNTDDGYMPFHGGAYNVTWNEDTAIVNYSYSPAEESSPEKWVELPIGL